MYKHFRNILAVAACLGLMVGAAGAAEANNPSRPFEKPLKAVQDAMAAKKFDEASARVAEARALPNPTAYDTYVINEFAGVIDYNRKKYAEAYVSLNANADSPFLAGKGDRHKSLAGLAYELKNYPAAIEHCNKAAQLGATGDGVDLIEMQAYYQLGKNKEAGTSARQMIELDEKAGRKPDKLALQILFQTQGKLNDAKGQGDTLEKMLRYYPTPDTWIRAIASLKDQADKSRDERLTLQVYRLMEEVGALKSWPQFNEMAQLAAGQGFPGESQRVLEAAFAKNLFPEGRDKERASRYLESSKKQAAAEKDGMGKVVTMAQAAADGNLLVAAGASYAFNYADAAKGVPLIQQGITKGSLKSMNDAYITLGAVAAKAGNKAEALKAFGKVEKDGVYENLAKLWSLHVR